MGVGWGGGGGWSISLWVGGGGVGGWVGGCRCATNGVTLI